MDHGSLPDGVAEGRTTPEFDRGTVPAGLLRAHRVAAGVWGLLHVRAGQLRFVWEDAPVDAATVELVAGDRLVIPPDVPHRVEVGDGGRFVVTFYS